MTSEAPAEVWISRIGRSVDRWAHVARYHRPEQLGRRLWNRMHLVAPIRASRSLLRQLPTVREIAFEENQSPLWQSPSLDAATLARGQLTLLNLSAELGRPIDWRRDQSMDAPRLWSFELHSMDWIESLVASDSSPQAVDLAWKLIHEWVVVHPSMWRRRFRDDAWHPYCVSRRIAVWTKFYQVSRPPEDLRGEILTSLAEQAEFLSRHFERDLGGNHLWENAQSLWIAGCFFEGPIADRWRRRGARQLDACLAAQLSPTGEQFEKSPMYQSRLARGLHTAATIGRTVDPNRARRYRDQSDLMTRMLGAICHPDGLPPLFGDTTLDESYPRSIVLDAPASDWVGEYFVHSRGGDRLIFDAGDLGPDHLPAHSHADLLNFEMSLDGRRAVVDSGVFAYSGPQRAQFRNSRSHNVLLIDDEELADCWADFRMGRRGHVVARASGVSREGAWVAAAHDAYVHRGIDRVDRIWFFANEGGPWFSIHLVRGSSRREHRLSEFVHWHPALNATLDAGAASISGLQRPVLWESAVLAEVECINGAYSERFYQASRRPVLVIHQTTKSLPALSAWTISRSFARVNPKVELYDASIDLSWKQGGSRRTARIALCDLDATGGDS